MQLSSSSSSFQHSNIPAMHAIFNDVTGPDTATATSKPDHQEQEQVPPPPLYSRYGLLALDVTLITTLLAMLVAGVYTLAAHCDPQKRRFTLFMGFFMTIGAIYQLVFFTCYLFSHLHPLKKSAPITPFVEQKSQLWVHFVAPAAILLASAGTLRAAFQTGGSGDGRVVAEGVYVVASMLAGIVIFVYRGYVRFFFPFSFGLATDVLFLLLCMVWLGVQLSLVILRWSFVYGF